MSQTESQSSPSAATKQERLQQGVSLAPEAREAMEYDVVVVGAGPAGLATAIHLKKMAQAQNKEINVCVLEKGAEVGAHILSGAVIDPVGLNQLFPDWKGQGAPLENPVTGEQFYVLTEKRAFPIPNIFLPPLMKNHGMYIASLGNLCRWLAQQAEAMGVEIYTGFAAAELLLNDAGAVCGVATGDMGVAKTGDKKDGWESGVSLTASYVVLAEGARGSLTKRAIEHFDLAKDSDPQKYGIGIKELWQIEPSKHKAGFVQHTLGWPLKNDTGGGSFLYHFGENYVALGFVTHLNYPNPYLSPFEELQRFKQHPKIRALLEGGRAVGYGARAITEGGWQSLPTCAFPGGVLVGCGAGMTNLPRIKGSHNAIESGILAAEEIFVAVGEERKNETLTSYDTALRSSRIARELKKIRNVKPLLSRFGTFWGTIFGGIEMWMRTLFLGLPYTLSHKKPDCESLKPAKDCEKIDYPKPDGKISFDRLSVLQLSATNHEEDQPAHLTLKDEEIPISHNLAEYAEPAQRYCPAGVYEIVGEEEGKPRLQINAQNCVHCKTCDIKDPKQNINWVVPEGGGGPNYPNM